MTATSCRYGERDKVGRVRASLALVAMGLWAGVAHAADPPAQLRMGTLVPDGTAWARELKAFAREVEDDAQLKVKFYWGGIAGDEREMLGRVKRGQLDGVAGAAVCTELAPSLQVTRLQGLFPNRDAHERLVRQIPNVDDEFKRAGFVNLGTAGMGPSIIFTRAPVTTWAELKKMRLWRWDLDPVAWQQARMMGLDVVPLSVNGGAAAFDDGKVDGFVALAASALAFQWQSRAPNILPLEMDYLNACFLVSIASWDELSLDTQRNVRAAAAKLTRRMELVGRDVDRVVIGGTLTGHGVHARPVPAATRDAFFAAAHETRARAAAQAHVPAEALRWVLQQLGLK
ncbi:MAG: TRAP-type C4-dicarboxylate transport system, substrate-binding protein [bacterium]|nr:TRAP-type C4-dicarboxylate transport system, substrate-binding protein [bacterium]